MWSLLLFDVCVPSPAPSVCLSLSPSDHVRRLISLSNTLAFSFTHIISCSNSSKQHPLRCPHRRFFSRRRAHAAHSHTHMHTHTRRRARRTHAHPPTHSHTHTPSPQVLHTTPHSYSTASHPMVPRPIFPSLTSPAAPEVDEAAAAEAHALVADVCWDTCRARAPHSNSGALRAGGGGRGRRSARAAGGARGRGGGRGGDRVRRRAGARVCRGRLGARLCRPREPGNRKKCC